MLRGVVGIRRPMPTFCFEYQSGFGSGSAHGAALLGKSWRRVSEDLRKKLETITVR